MVWIESFLTYIKDYIQNNIDTALTCVTEAMGDTLVVPRPRGYAINDNLELDQMPFVQVIPDTSTVIIPAQKWEEVDHKIVIIVHAATNSDTETCAKYIYRYTQAIEQICMFYRTMESRCIGWTIEHVDYKPMFSDGVTMKQEVWIHCNIKAIDFNSVISIYFWNKLGSDAQVAASEIGANGALVGVPTYAAAKFGNGVVVNNLNYPSFPSALTSTGVGLIEFWWKPGYDHNLVAQREVIRFTNGLGDYITLGHGNNGGRRLEVIIYKGGVGNACYYRWSTVVWNSGVNNHMVIGYDSNGAAGRRLLLWIDGNIRYANFYDTDAGWSIAALDWIAAPGATYTDAVIDNLKLYSSQAEIATILAGRNSEYTC